MVKADILYMIFGRSGISDENARVIIELLTKFQSLAPTLNPQQMMLFSSIANISDLLMSTISKHAEQWRNEAKGALTNSELSQIAEDFAYIRFCWAALCVAAKHPESKSNYALYVAELATQQNKIAGKKDGQQREKAAKEKHELLLQSLLRELLEAGRDIGDTKTSTERTFSIPQARDFALCLAWKNVRVEPAEFRTLNIQKFVRMAGGKTSLCPHGRGRRCELFRRYWIPRS